jgi:hypothetical protein
MNRELAAIEEVISKRAREAAIRDVGKVFSNLSMDLYHLGFNDLDEFQQLQSKVVEEVTRAKAELLAEEILRRNDALTKDMASDDEVVIIDEDLQYEEVPDDD